MSKSRKSYTRAFKLKVLAEVASGRPIAEVTKEHGLTKNAIYKWQELHQRYEDLAFSGNGNAYTLESRMSEMQQLIGQLTVDNQVLKKALRQRQEEEAKEK